MGERWDVIIVGLGPAGAAAAHALAAAGARVLALDGRPRHPKPCGGCVSARSGRLLEAAGLVPAAWLRAHPVDVTVLEAVGRPGLRHATASPGAWFVERGRLDELLRERAAAAGAEVVRARARTVSPEGGGWRVSARFDSWRGDWLIGADGAAGPVGRSLGLGRTRFAYLALVEERPMPQALAAELTGVSLLELGAVPGGYGWLFGRGESLNLGLAGRVGRVGGARALERLYAGFLARHGLGAPGRWRGAFIPCPDGGPIRVAAGRAAVIGDAAGAADPFLGEGIGQAAQTGLMAARAILAGDLGRYQADLAATLWREHASARRLAKLVYRAPRFFQGLARRRPGAVELAWRVLRGELGYDRLWGAVWRRLLGLDGVPAKP
ncbi:MAG: FAD-dependent monooxygenase [Thermodesulfobacteriota bacterium]